jgi:hypothetical protein
MGMLYWRVSALSSHFDPFTSETAILANLPVSVASALGIMLTAPAHALQVAISILKPVAASRPGHKTEAFAKHTNFSITKFESRNLRRGIGNIMKSFSNQSGKFLR